MACSLHAAVRCGINESQRLEQLCRTSTRPAQDRRTRADQQRHSGAVRLKTPWRDGTTHLVLSPLEFMRRLAARVDRSAPSGHPRPGLGCT